MAQHSGPDHANARRDARHGPRLAALVALAAATSSAAALLTLRVLTLADDLPTPRFETYLELPLVGAGGLLAAWVAINSLLAVACVLVRAAGHRWSAGERIVRQHAPALVRRLASTSVAVSVGAGLVLGAGSAQAAEVDPAAPVPAPAVVDLGWQSTSPEQAVAPEAALPAAGPTEVLADSVADSPESAPPVPDDREHPAAETGTDTGTPTVDPGSPISSDLGTGQTDDAVPSTVAPGDRDAGSPAPPPTDVVSSTGAARPGHVPLSGLLGGAQRVVPAPRADSPPAVASSGPTRSEGSGTAVLLPDVGNDASTVSVVVLRGDSLWSLAERALGEGATDAEVAAEWQRWYAANTAVIGEDPDLIRPGQVLRAPRTP
ncbi:LysM peptidoglycan-binding domain-containing protein [Oerskovia sp. USHLN155]|uniref:LysM peptidoglycan-binding domain-containing protein n=1 Tax=Oerskovia sp. USHLN155 TaxID=3081288 RepID=UPI0030164CDC